MKTRDFAANHIRFSKTSPVTGLFRLAQYPFLGKPMDAADDIRVKRLIIFKAASCLGTVLGQIINAKRIVCDAGDQKMVCQTDDDGAMWTKTRGKEWIMSIPDAVRLISKEKYSVTNDLWIFRHKFLEISGPGINAAQSVQVRYLQTDESHLEAYPQGRLVEFEKRMGTRFDQQATHITTAPDVGREVDSFYMEGQQDEWALRCKCGELVLPLWHEESRAKYNGEQVWQERDGNPLFVCPYCSHAHGDTDRERYALTVDGDYLTQNPSAPIQTRSFQWPVWATSWSSWRKLFAEYRLAIEAAKLGDLKGLEDWRKKRECRSYTPSIPDFGNTQSGGYNLGDIWAVIEPRRFCGFDFQEGKQAEGVHWWGQIDSYALTGDSRRIAFNRLESWADCRAFQLRHGVLGCNTFCDAGHRDKEVFARCAEWQWYAMLSSDDELFHHRIRIDNQESLIENPYFTQTKAQNPMSGQAGNQTRKKKRGIVSLTGTNLPRGWCWSRTWSKPNIGYLLLRLKSGLAGVSYGIASDIDPRYTAQLNSYMETYDIVKRTNTRRRILKQIREDDHSFATSSLCLLGAIIRGYFPLSKQTEAKAA